ncbi:MAG: hypothetical protein LBE23_13680 [Vagococcus sp.]|jgi:hypothetical protein|nr:hypothetical protein [Vagococcus sp.]
MKYRKKPVVIEAVQFLGFESNDNFSERPERPERPEWLVKAIYKDETVKLFGEPNKLTIETLEGTIFADVGDYIIRGIQGEIYPCKPDIFEETYERVD